MTMADLLPLMGWALAGAALGALYLALLARTVAAVTAGGGGAGAAGFLLMRVVLAVLAFWAAAAQGALPLLATLGGFLAARAVAVAHARRG